MAEAKMILRIDAARPRNEVSPMRFDERLAAILDRIAELRRDIEVDGGGR